MQDVRTSQCPFGIDKDTKTEPVHQSPHFLGSLAATNALDTDDMLGITMDLFIAGIDSVSGDHFQMTCTTIGIL